MMGAKTCMICNAALDGWVYDEKVLRDARLHVQDRTALICHSCGAAVCFHKHDKHFKGGNWLSLDKATCPHCGGRFGPSHFMTAREVSRAEPKELPAGLMTPWALTYLDAATGETLVAADKPRTDFAFSLIVTNRRLIVVDPTDLYGLGNKAHALVVLDRHYMTWPLHNLVSIETKVVESHTSKLTIKTDTGESHTWETSPPFDHMAGYIQAARPAATRPLIFPADEQVFFDGGANLDLLAFTEDSSPFHDTELVAMHFWNRHARLSLAVTNRRLLFYRINHIHGMDWTSLGLNVTLGAPLLQSISLPWEAVHRIVVAGGLLGGRVSLVLDQPLWAWTTPSLAVLPVGVIKTSYETRACARCGGTISGGVGPKRKDPAGKDIDASVVGSYCPQCNLAHHKSCLKTLESPTSKCPTCGQPRQVIDRGYYTTTYPLEAAQLAAAMLKQINTPPVGKPGEEWRPTLTKNVKAWETHILPAVRQANPQVPIEAK